LYNHTTKIIICAGNHASINQAVNCEVNYKNVAINCIVNRTMNYINSVVNHVTFFSLMKLKIYLFFIKKNTQISKILKETQIDRGNI